MNFEQIKEILKKNKVSGDQIADGYGLPAELGDHERVDYTGSDFEGDRLAVRHFIDHDIFIGVEGYDSSYEDSYGDDSYGGDGGDYTDWQNNFKEVKPVVRTVTEYEKK